MPFPPSFEARSRYTRTASLLLALAMVAGCHDDATQPERYVLAATVSNTLWVGKAGAAMIPQADSAWITVFAQRPETASRPSESVYIHFVAHGAGTYDLDAGDVQLYQTVGGDVLVSSYLSTGPVSGHVTISSYDGYGSVIEGEFEFDAAHQSGSETYGPNVHFENGHFRAVLSPLYID
jgi:hypothetical protein